MKHFNAPTLLCGRACLLTSDGVNAAATAMGSELPYSIYPASFSHSLLKHNSAAQSFGILCHRAGY